MDRIELAAHETICSQQMEILNQQKLALERRIRKLQYHMEALDTIRYLQNHPYEITTIDLDCIIPFELIEITKLKQYIENPRLYSRVQHSTDLSWESRGLSITRVQKSQEGYGETLWENHGGRYIVCLMREQIAPGYPNDLAKHLAVVQKKYDTGFVISRFLTCAQESGRSYDFYQTYFEIT